MTRKHFQAIANVIRGQWDMDGNGRAAHIAPNDLIDAFVTMLENENPLFNEDKFREACTPSQDNWIPACGGTETPFRARSGATLHYMWNNTTGEHAYYHVNADVFLTTEEALAHLEG